MPKPLAPLYHLAHVLAHRWVPILNSHVLAIMNSAAMNIQAAMNITGCNEHTGA